MSDRVPRISDDYHKVFEGKKLFKKIKWLGVPILKYPNDAFIIQEIIFEVYPDILIECGTAKGGSSLFFASIMEVMGRGMVYTIDIEKNLDLTGKAVWPAYRRIRTITGKSTDQKIVSDLKEIIKGRKVMVVLDSDHREENVAKELKIYSDFVSRESYLIVEDTHVNGNPFEWPYGRGPMEAVQGFLARDDRFVVDESREKLIMTSNPFGYLRRIK